MSRTATPEKAENPKPKPSEPANPADGEPPRSIRVSPFVKLFVAFHIVAITVWAIPNPPAPYTSGRVKWQVQTDNVTHFAQSLNDGVRLLDMNKLKPSLIKYYDIPTGFWQYWDMFAPNPANIDWYGDAEVIYKNGAHMAYLYPRMYKLGIVQKYFMERFRKYYERAHDDAYSYVWPAFAQRVALNCTNDAGNPVVEVRLRRHWLEIQPPGKDQPTAYNSYEYFRWPVDQVKLLRDLHGGG